MKQGLDRILGQLDDRNWFQKALDEVFEKKKKPVRQIDYFYASWAGECPRVIQYVMNGMVHDDIDPQSQRRMDNGNYMHDRYGDYFESIGILIAREPAFRLDMDGVFVSGRGDLILTDDNSTHVLVEMKSINDKGYGGILLCPREDHFLQWNLCSKALQIPQGIILYENKDNQLLKPHFVKFSQEKYDLVIKKFQDIDAGNKAGKTVAKPEVCVNPKYCKAKGLCKQDA